MLNDKQEAAIDLLVAGRKGVDIEKEVGVSHAQLYRWKQDAEFVARWEDARAQVHEQRAEKLFEVGNRALDVALATLDEGDPINGAGHQQIPAPALVDVRYVSSREATPTRGASPGTSWARRSNSPPVRVVRQGVENRRRACEPPTDPLDLVEVADHQMSQAIRG